MRTLAGESSHARAAPAQAESMGRRARFIGTLPSAPVHNRQLCHVPVFSLAGGARPRV